MIFNIFCIFIIFHINLKKKEKLVFFLKPTDNLRAYANILDVFNYMKFTPNISFFTQNNHMKICCTMSFKLSQKQP